MNSNVGAEAWFAGSPIRSAGGVGHVLQMRSPATSRQGDTRPQLLSRLAALKVEIVRRNAELRALEKQFDATPNEEEVRTAAKSRVEGTLAAQLADAKARNRAEAERMTAETENFRQLAAEEARRLEKRLADERNRRANEEESLLQALQSGLRVELDSCKAAHDAAVSTKKQVLRQANDVLEQRKQELAHLQRQTAEVQKDFAELETNLEAELRDEFDRKRREALTAEAQKAEEAMGSLKESYEEAQRERVRLEQQIVAKRANERKIVADARFRAEQETRFALEAEEKALQAHWQPLVSSAEAEVQLMYKEKQQLDESLPELEQQLKREKQSQLEKLQRIHAKEAAEVISEIEKMGEQLKAQRTTLGLLENEKRVQETAMSQANAVEKDRLRAMLENCELSVLKSDLELKLSRQNDTLQRIEPQCSLKALGQSLRIQIEGVREVTEKYRKAHQLFEELPTARSLEQVAALSEKARILQWQLQTDEEMVGELSIEETQRQSAKTNDDMETVASSPETRRNSVLSADLNVSRLMGNSLRVSTLSPSV